MYNGISLCPSKKLRYNQVLNCRVQCQVACSLKAICWFTQLMRLILIAKRLPALGHVPSTFRQLIGGQEALSDSAHRIFGSVPDDQLRKVGLASKSDHTQNKLQTVVDLSRFRAAPSARLSPLAFESDGAFPTQC